MSQYHSKARYTISICMHVLRTHTLHKSTVANEPDTQKQLFNVSTILLTVEPMMNKFVDDLLVKILTAGAQSVLEIVQVGNRNTIYALLHTA